MHFVKSFTKISRQQESIIGRGLRGYRSVSRRSIESVVGLRPVDRVIDVDSVLGFELSV